MPAHSSVLAKGKIPDVKYDPMTLSGFNKAAVHVGSISYNVLAVTVQRATAPGFPVKIKVTSKTKMRFIGVMRAYNENGYKAI